MSVALRAVRVLARCYALMLLVASACWLLVECAPGSTAERAAVAGGALVPGDVTSSAEERAAIVEVVAQELGIATSAGHNVGRQVWKAARLDFGVSWRDGASVGELVVSSRGLSTLSLCVAALLLAFAAALLLAPRAAQFPTSRGSRLGAAVAAALLCTPIPWLAMLSQEALSYGNPLSILPKGGLHGLGHAILPVAVLGAVPAAVLYTHLRSALRRELAAPWADALRARGVPAQRLWRTHGLKLALPTVVALLPVMVAYLLAASLVVERVFAIEGVGTLLGRAALLGDSPVIVAVASATVALVHLASLGCDALNRYLDPRRAKGTRS